MGANEARHVLDMTADLSRVLALELYTAAQALDYRRDMIEAARRLARRGDVEAIAGKIRNAPAPEHPDRARFIEECRELMAQLAQDTDFHAAPPVRKAHARLRQHIAFMQRDRAMDAEVAQVCQLVEQGCFDW